MPRSLTDHARRAARLGLSRGLRVATAPARAVARAAIARRPELESRLGPQAWLWQPGWGRACHDRLYRTADPYELTRNDYEQAKYELLVHTLDSLHAARALEVGCGEGLFSRRLLPFTDELVGVDLSAAAVERARERLGGDPRARFEVRTLPFDLPEGTFDLIVCSDVLYFWDAATLRIGLDRLLARLRPGGHLLLLHYLGDFGQAGSGGLVHDTALALARPGGALTHLTGVRIPGRTGAGGPETRLDLFSAAPAVSPPVPRPRPDRETARDVRA